MLPELRAVRGDFRKSLETFLNPTTGAPVHPGMTVDEFSRTDLAYVPPFSPVWDPMLTAANQLLKHM